MQAMPPIEDRTIHVAVDVPEEFWTRVAYTFDTLALRWGIPVALHRNGEQANVHFRYGRHAQDPELDIRFDASLSGPSAPTALRSEGESTLWTGTAEPNDVIGPIFRLLSLADELEVPDELRDQRGNLGTDAIPPGRREAAQLPIVEFHADWLLQRIRRRYPEVARHAVPRWPHGKSYAVALTHDTDAVNLGAAKELATNLTKFVVRRDATFLRMFLTGARHLGRPATNPYFSFAGWREFEDALGTKSCFYLFARPPGVPGVLNDCKSSVLDRGTDWESLRRISDAGWEFGLHAPILAKRDAAFLRACKTAIEARLERPVEGVRHHYWSLDWKRPHETFRRHIEAGLSYDSSLAWRDQAGFRAGTSLPFSPYDWDTDCALPLDELPACLMDGHVLPDRDLGAAANRAGQVIDRTKQVGGVAVLNWHTESFCNMFVFRGYRTVLEHLLVRLAADTQAWFATPSEILRHWRRRREAILGRKV